MICWKIECSDAIQQVLPWLFDWKAKLSYCKF